MDNLIIWLCIAIAVGSFIWGVDRHLSLRDVEISLKDYLGDLLVDTHTAASKTCECCTRSRVLDIKTLIRKHFKL
jgi:hypothetical protein